MNAESIRRTIDAALNAVPFRPDLASLEHFQCPDWYRDGKFGIFIHWGVYSVPAYSNEWYPRQMYRQGTREYEHHLKTYGPHDKFGYKDFIPMFKAEKFDAAAWAELFRAAGAKFVVPVAEHHDGFAMYDSELNPWNAAKMGPKRDVLGELADAIRSAGMVFGLSSHRAEHYWFFDGGTQFDSDVNDPANAGLYGVGGVPTTRMQPELQQQFHAFPPSPVVQEDWLLHTAELVEKYRPDLVWFDWWINNFGYQKVLREFAAYYYNRAAGWGRGVAINYKNQAYTPASAVFDIERGQLDEIYPQFWQNDTAVSKSSWGYTENQDYKDSNSIIADLVDVVSKNGALLLNVGPRPDGTIPEEDQRILLEIGNWLKVNGEAIYGTRPWLVYGEGPTKVAAGAFSDTDRAEFTSADIRFTRKGETLYALPLARPADGIVKIRTLAAGLNTAPGTIHEVELPGHGPVPFRRDRDALTVELPYREFSATPCVLKLRCDLF